MLVAYREAETGLATLWRDWRLVRYPLAKIAR